MFMIKVKYLNKGKRERELEEKEIKNRQTEQVAVSF